MNQTHFTKIQEIMKEQLHADSLQFIFLIFHSKYIINSVFFVLIYVTVISQEKPFSIFPETVKPLDITTNTARAVTVTSSTNF